MKGTKTSFETGEHVCVYTELASGALKADPHTVKNMMLAANGRDVIVAGRWASFSSLCLHGNDRVNAWLKPPMSLRLVQGCATLPICDVANIHCNGHRVFTLFCFFFFSSF